jgi:hypothetical protein
MQENAGKLMYGSFDENARAVWDFTRCQRPNGTFYGTRGKCKSGDEVGAKELPAPKAKKAAAKKTTAKPAMKAKAKAALDKATPEQLEKLKSNPKVTPAQKKVLDKAIAEKTGKAKKPESKKAAAAKPDKEEAAKASETKAIEKELAKLEKQQSRIEKDFVKGRKRYEDMDEGTEKDKFGAKLEAMAKTYQENKKKITELKNKGAKSSELDKDDLVDRDEERNRRGKIYREAQNNTNLSEKQRAAIRDYTDEGGQRPYSALNACLRQPRTCEKENRGWTRQQAKELDSALKTLPKNDNAEPFWRGTRADSGQALALYQALENAQPGMRMRDPAFGSYSYDESTARGFTSRTTKSILFVSRSKQLTPIDTFSEISIEREALLPRDTEQTIRSVRKDGEMLIVEID